MANIRKLGAVVLLIGGALSAHAGGGIDYPSAWECSTTKFNWYCVVDQSDKRTDAKGKTNEEDAMEKLEQWKKELEGKRALAVINPTPENVKAYIAAQNAAMNNAAIFSDVWRRVIWQTPELNYELKRPVNNTGIEIYKEVRKKEELRTIQSLANEWGMFFFFRSDCPYCHRMASTLKLMEQMYGLTVFPVSLDGGTVPGYPNPKKDNGLAAMLGISQVPTIALGNVKTKRMIPLGSGVVSITDLIERIYILTQTKPGDTY